MPEQPSAVEDEADAQPGRQQLLDKSRRDLFAEKLVLAFDRRQNARRCGYEIAFASTMQPANRPVIAPMQGPRDVLRDHALWIEQRRNCRASHLDERRVFVNWFRSRCHAIR